MKIVKNLLSLTLCFQLALASIVTYGVPSFSVAADVPPATPSLTIEDSQRVQKILSTINAANTETFPTEKADAFHLTNQTVVISKSGKDSVFELSRPDLAVPTTTIADFERDVVIRANSEGSLELVYTKRGKNLARQTISSVKPLAMARDKELLVILDQTGELLAVDLGYARLVAFTGPLPVVSVGSSALTKEELKTAKAAYRSRGQLRMKRSSNPRHIFPLRAHAGQTEETLMSGDLLLYTESADGERTHVGEFDRDVIRTQLYTAEATLAMFAFVISPPDDAPKVAEHIAQLMVQTDVAAQAERVSELSDAERDAFSSLTIQRLLQRAAANVNKPSRDRYSRSEDSDFTSRFIELAKSARGRKAVDQELRASGELGELTAEQMRELAARNQKLSVADGLDPRPLWYRLLSSKRLQVMAAVSAGAAATVGIGAHTAWGVLALNVMYARYWPSVLKDSAYRWTLLKSSLALSSFVPLSYLLGMSGSKKSGFNAKKSLASMTVKIYAELILPFWHRMGGLIRQPNLMLALSQGLSPLQKIEIESPVGQKLGLDHDIRPALSNPFASRESRDLRAAKGAEILTALAQQKARVHSLAWLVSLEVASREAGLDPVTLATLSGENADRYRKEQFEAAIKSPDFIREWSQLATELQFEFARIARNDDLDAVSKIDPKDLNMYFEFAQARAKEIKSRDRGGRLLASLKSRWSKLGSSGRKGFATLAVSDYQFLREAVPSDAVVSLFWTQFTTDYFLAIGEIGVVGPRADLHNPTALAANEHSLLWTTPGHRFDMIDQLRLYMLAVPASFMLTFQDPSQVRETGYDPLEMVSLQGRSEKQSLKPAIKTWLKDAFDPKRADEYGQRSIRAFTRRFRTMQFNFSMSLIARVFVAGQSLGPALASYVYFFEWAPWGYGLVWDPVNIGNLRYETKFEARRAQLVEAHRKIGEGLRLDDLASLGAGIDELSRLYIDNDRVTSEMPNLAALETLLKSMTPADLIALQTDSLPYLNAVTELRRAIQDGSPNRISVARSALANVYKARGLDRESAAVVQLDSLHLLEYSLRNPPFETHQNAVVPFLTTLTAALSSTYLATKMGVFTLSAHVNWTAELSKVTVLSAGLYASYYAATKWIAKKARTRAETNELATSSKENLERTRVQRARLVQSCQAVFLGI